METGQIILKKNNKVFSLSKGDSLSKVEVHYKATVIETVWYWQEDRRIDQWNRTERRERDMVNSTEGTGSTDILKQKHCLTRTSH